MNKAPDQILDRAVEIWKRLLPNAKFDNGDPSPQGDMTSMMAAMLHQPPSDDALEKFGVALRLRLGTPDKYGGYSYSLGVDYEPDAQLSKAAEEAGIPATSFPWKTRMYIDDESVGIGVGYRAEMVYHYPLKDGRWLMTSLRGADIAKVIAAVEGGPLELKIEAPLAEPVAA